MNSGAPDDYSEDPNKANRDIRRNNQLEPITPRKAVELYLQQRRSDLSEKSLQNQRYRLDSFVEWCEEEGLDNLNNLTGRHLHQFQSWRLDQGISKVTLQGVLQTLRVFLEFCANIDAVSHGMRERIDLPDVSSEEEASDEMLDESRARSILQYLEKYEYASRRHVGLAILWHTGCRLGTLRALDVDDFDPHVACFDVRHRPETGTPLKNGEAAERSIAVGEYYCEVISDYIEQKRPDVSDEYGREPFLASEQGRLSESTIREDIYQITRPCVIGQDCPHDRDPEECEAMEVGKASRCPSSKSPHPVRRGSITKHLREGVPKEIVSERSNVSGEVLDQHYDERNEREKMEIRREYIDGA